MSVHVLQIELYLIRISANVCPDLMPLLKNTCGHAAGSVCRLVPCLERFLLQILEQQAYTHTLISHRGQGAEGRHQLSCEQVKHMAGERKWITI